MFTDIQGYTALVSVDEEQALSFVRTHRETLVEQTKSHHGEVIEFYGDGSLSLYDSAVDAVQCAIEMQKVYQENDRKIPVRIGIHLGDVVMRDGSIFGNGVNVASRIESIGIPGNILVSEQVHEELKNQGNIHTKGLGKYKFKNVDKPLQIYGVDHPSVVLPDKKYLSGPKGKRVRTSNTLISILGTLILLFCFYFFDPFSFFGKDLGVQEERISVPPFKNFTGSPDLDYIGDMAAHWITKDLLLTEAANVVAFHSNNEIQQLAVASAGQEINKVFAQQAGALNILEGTYNRISKDSAEFSMLIKRVDNAEVRYAFDPIRFSIESPVTGIKKLTSLVNGYWEAHDELLLSMPNFDAYKYYMKARSIWDVNGQNDSLIVSYLNRSIRADSSFLDPYFLLVGHFYNLGDFEQVEQILNRMSPKMENKSLYEKNIYLYEKANLIGNNKTVYNIAMDDLEKFERDFFTTTDYLVYALEFVNNPAKTIEIFVDKKYDQLELANCAYCVESYQIAVDAYIRSKKFKEAENLLEAIPDHQKSSRYFSLYIKLLSQQGELDRIDQLIQSGARLLANEDEYVPRFQYIAARELHNNDMHDESKAYARLLLAQADLGPVRAGWAHYFLGDLDQALRAFEAVGSNDTENISIISQIGIIQARMGRVDESKKVIADLAALNAPFQYGTVPYAQARIHQQLGESDKALDLLQQAVDEGAKFYANNVFDQDPDLQGLVDNPRFQEIIHPLGVPAVD